MALYFALESRASTVPRRFLNDLGDSSLEEVDCYSLAEYLLDDAFVAALDGKTGARIVGSANRARAHRRLHRK